MSQRHPQCRPVPSRRVTVRAKPRSPRTLQALAAASEGTVRTRGVAREGSQRPQPQKSQRCAAETKSQDLRSHPWPPYLVPHMGDKLECGRFRLSVIGARGVESSAGQSPDQLGRRSPGPSALPGASQCSRRAGTTGWASSPGTGLEALPASWRVEVAHPRDRQLRTPGAATAIRPAERVRRSLRRRVAGDAPIARLG